MGIFSFGNQDDDRPKRGTRTGSRNERGAGRGQQVRRRRTERPAADPFMLDPTLPEKQRARRRLVGAIALVVAAIIILPLVLDSHPKPLTNDIAIDIPNPPAGASSAPSATTTAANDDASSGAAPSSQVLQPVAPAAVAAVAAPAAASFKPAPLSPATAPAAATKVSAPAPIAPAQTAAADGGDASTPAAPPGGHFAVQLGEYHSEASADSWAERLKKLGVPAYVEHRQQADGSTLIVLRAGPFANRDDAAAAVAKVRGAGFAQ